jgi:hypothetical protein
MTGPGQNRRAVQKDRTGRQDTVKGTPFLEGVSTLYEMCIIVLLVNVLG